VPTPEQVAQIEARYAELAVPQEFDGIRTQIAQELSIPKKAVKKVVQAYRTSHDMPSWWETQSYKGDSEELAKIKAAYEPYLPVPPVGIHKKIAEELSLKAGEVYQAIKTIRLEMNLPQFNDPVVHAEELAARNKRKAGEDAQVPETGVNGAGAVGADGTQSEAALEGDKAAGSADTSSGEKAAQPVQTAQDEVAPQADAKQTEAEAAGE
jgi:hypothetical protein